MAIDMSPQAIERRLKQVAEARKLGLSLRRAGSSIRDGAKPEDRDDSSISDDGDTQRSDRPVPR